MTIDPHFWVWPDELSPALCAEIIRIGKTLPIEEGRVGGKSDTDEGTVQKEARESRVGFFNDDHWIEGIVWHYMRLANVQAWKFLVSSCQTVQFTQYEKGEYYGPHCDTFGLNEDMRKLSICIQLSDPKTYEGGAFEFEHPDGSFIPDGFAGLGSVMVFPSFLYHQVHPVTSGERYSSVSWVLGPQIR